MPECLECGNKEAFLFEEQTQSVRLFDPETGEHIDTEHEESMDATLLACEECKSSKVEY